MEKYDRVVKKRDETPIDANEIRITSMGRARNYITYAMTLLQVLIAFIWKMCQSCCWEGEIWSRVYVTVLSTLTTTFR